MCTEGRQFFSCVNWQKRITVPVSLDFMSVSSYGSDTKSSGVVKIVKDLDESLKDKDVIVVEDIVDSGRTFKLSVRDAEGQRTGFFTSVHPVGQAGEKSDRCPCGLYRI